MTTTACDRGRGWAAARGGRARGREGQGALETGLAFKGGWGIDVDTASYQQGGFPVEGLKVGPTCIPMLTMALDNEFLPS